MKLKYSLFALIALAVAGCQKAPVYDDVVYIAGAEGEVPTLSLTLDDQFPKELSVKVSSSIVVGHDTKVRLVTDPSKIEEYNTQYGKKGVMLPETNFVLKNTELTIPAGSFSAAEPLVVSVTKDEGLKEGVSYVIPLSIESVDGDLKVKEGFRTVFVEIGRIIIGPAADCSGSTYFKVDFAEGEQDKYDIYNLGEVTYEARINLQRWGGWCNTVMGLEENFCLRFVQDDFKGQLQLSGESQHERSAEPERDGRPDVQSPALRERRERECVLQHGRMPAERDRQQAGQPRDKAIDQCFPNLQTKNLL